MQLTKTILTTLTLSTLVWSNVLAKESKIIVSTGRIISELKPFDELMEEFILKNEIPGASVAVAKDGRLVYARGFGYAEVDKKKPSNLTPYSGLPVSPNPSLP